jgi:hypothetical protein
LDQPEIAIIAIITAKPDEADRASQRYGKAVSRTVRLDDLIGEFEVFSATNTNTVDRFAGALAVVFEGRNGRLFTAPFPRPRRFHLAADSSAGRQGQNSLDGEPGFDIPEVAPGNWTGG